jgi:hypothetical protein
LTCSAGGSTSAAAGRISSWQRWASPNAPSAAADRHRDRLVCAHAISLGSRASGFGLRGSGCSFPKPSTRNPQPVFRCHDRCATCHAAPGNVLDDGAGMAAHRLLASSPARLWATARSGRGCCGGVWSCPAVAVAALPAPPCPRAARPAWGEGGPKPLSAPGRAGRGDGGRRGGSAATGHHANPGQARVRTSSKITVPGILK